MERRQEVEEEARFRRGGREGREEVRDRRKVREGRMDIEDETGCRRAGKMYRGRIGIGECV